MNPVKLLLCCVVALGFTTQAVAEDYRPFLDRHCVACHGAETQEADLRFDQIVLPPGGSDDSELWRRIYRAVDSGEMPPAEEPRPDAEASDGLLDRIAAELAKVSPPTPALRRMNRVEYENTVRDLLSIDVDLADLLPEDGSVQGFDNVAGGLGLSSILMERYLEAADKAFDAVIRRVKPLPPETRRAVLMEVKNNIEAVEQSHDGVIAREGAYVDFSPGWPPARIDPAHPIEDGTYRCRVAVWPHEPGERRTLAVAIFVGPLFGPGKRELAGIFDVTGTPDDPRIIEFEARMAEADALHILPWIYPEHVTWRDKEEARPGVGIVWAETYGPLDQSFPSEPQKRLFGESDTLSMVEGESIYIRHRRGVKSHRVESSAPREDAERIVRAFVPRAFRRPVEPELADAFVQLTLSRLDAGSSFEDAVRAGVSAVLCSPHFLLLNREPEVDNYEIASRLSYFLWSSMPDDELLRLAGEGKLRDPAIRREQVERMLDDPKNERFVENFTGQWLDLRDLEFTTPDKTLYPEYDDLLLRSMASETRGFFRHLLKEDLSVRNFVDSDFAILNQRMAEHYGVEGVRGHEQFRVMPLPEESVRGGLLTQASILKVTANGTSTSPVLRGAWVLENLLGQPAPPPPAGVPAVEPDIRGATSIREQLERHRADASCARCHARIDPPGFALEEFDVIGGQRDRYRTMEQGERVAKVNYRLGPAVECGDRFPDGREFSNFAEFRNALLEDSDAVARCVAEKLLVYGCGRPVSIEDRASVESVVEPSRTQDHGLRSIIHAVVESELFLRP
jgi:hypothetical protein